MEEQELSAVISQSGNSDVDIDMVIDTASLAYMYACSLLATEQIDENQFKRMIDNYHDLMRKHRHKHRSETKPHIENHPSNVRLLGPVKRLRR